MKMNLGMALEWIEPFSDLLMEVAKKDPLEHSVHERQFVNHFEEILRKYLQEKTSSQLVSYSVRARKMRSAPQNSIRTRRISRGLTLYQLAKLTNLSYSYIQRLEAGTRRLNIDTLKIISEALGCSPEDIITV